MNSAGPIKYHKLRSGGYELLSNWWVDTPLRDQAARVQDADGKTYVTLTSAGRLSFAAGYRWDGPSGPTIDTKTFMRGPLAHDGLYQLMRARRLPQECRKAADQLLRDLCKVDGMIAPRRWWVYWGLRAFAGWAAKPQPDQEIETLTAP